MFCPFFSFDVGMLLVEKLLVGLCIIIEVACTNGICV